MPALTRTLIAAAIGLACIASVSLSNVTPALATGTDPTVTINQAVSQVDPTTTSPIAFTATFSESVTGFTGTDINLAGSTAGGTLVSTVTGGPTTYTVKVSGMTTAGAVVASIPADAAMDTNHNPNEASTSTDNSVTWVPDTTKPDVTINQAASQTDPTSVTPIAFTATFSESVTGFTATDIELSGSTAGGTLAPTVTGGPTTYTVKVTGMTTQGAVIVSIPAGAAMDASSNPSNASTSTDNSVTWVPDFIAPDVTINQAASQTDPASTSPIRFTVTFSEPVTGFTHTDVRLGQSRAGGVLVPTVHGGPTVYTVSVTGMTNSGKVVATIPAGAARDDANNPSNASTSTDNTVSWHRLPRPNTHITSQRIKPHARSARFSFNATGRATRFQCALAKGHAKLHFHACGTPKSYAHLAAGAYTFAVRAIGPGGADKTPAKRRFDIPQG